MAWPHFAIRWLSGYGRLRSQGGPWHCGIPLKYATAATLNMGMCSITSSDSSAVASTLYIHREEVAKPLRFFKNNSWVRGLFLCRSPQNIEYSAADVLTSILKKNSLNTSIMQVDYRDRLPRICIQSCINACKLCVLRHHVHLHMHNACDARFLVHWPVTFDLAVNSQNFVLKGLSDLNNRFELR